MTSSQCSLNDGKELIPNAAISSARRSNLELRKFCAKRKSESVAYLTYVRNSLIEVRCKSYRSKYAILKKLIWSEEILCQTKKRVRSILDVCEELAY